MSNQNDRPAGEKIPLEDDHLLALIVKSASDAIILLDLFGQIMYANSAAGVLCNLSPDKIRGRHIGEIIDMGHAGDVLRLLRANQVVQVETDVFHGRNRRQPVLAAFFPLHDEDAAPPSAAAAILRDASRQRQALAETQRQLDELQLLNRVRVAVTSSLELENILSIVLEETRRTLDVEACSIALLDEDVQDLFFIMAEGIGASHVRGTRIPASQGVIGWVVRNHQSLIVPDVASDPRFFAGIDNVTGARTRSLMCTPLEAHGRIIGAIEAMNKKAGEFDEDDLRLFRLIAASSSTAIANALLYSQQKELTEKLRRRQRSLLESYRQRGRYLGEALSQKVEPPINGILQQSEALLQRGDLPDELVQELARIQREARRIREVMARWAQESEATTDFVDDPYSEEADPGAP